VIRRRESQAEVLLENNNLSIKIAGNMRVRTIDVILKEMLLKKRKAEYVIESAMILDLSELVFISPAAATGIVCLCSALMSNKMTVVANPSAFYMRRPPENVLTYLSTFHFFTQLINKANLLGCEDLAAFESERTERKSKVKKIDGPDNEEKPIVLPMRTIPQKGAAERDHIFEQACLQFINEIYPTFRKLFSSVHFNFYDGDIYQFKEANGELFVNVFEHSRSWGIASIHANPRSGTIVSYCDIGVGMKGSVNSSPKARKEYDVFETDTVAIKWALKEGNSSKVGGNGRGLNVVEEFVLQRKGNIELRSGSSLFRKKPGDKPGVENWSISSVPWFPGTQINFFVPCMDRIDNGAGRWEA